MNRFIIVIWLAALAINSHAEGYQVNVQSQKNTAMGHTGTALMLGASSVHFNPGALGLMKKNYDITLGGSFVFSNVTFSKQNSTYQTETESPTGTPFYFYGAARLSDRLVAGLGINTPFGNSLAWKEDWDGRYLIQDISLRAIVVQPTLSFKISDKLGFGAGAMIVFGGVDLNKALPLMGPDGEAHVNINGTTTSFGFNAGLYYQASDALSFGLDYRSKVAMEMEGGDADFFVAPGLSAAFPAKNKFDAELPLPANLTLGAGYKVNNKLTLAADLQYVFWDAYQELVFDFQQNTPQLFDSYNPREYKNTMIYRLGAEYLFSDKLIVRAGAYFDETPISDEYLNPETPGMNKVGMSLGASYFLNDKWSVDASFLYITGMERDAGYQPANFYGTYNSRAIIPGIGITYAF
ncbi:long-chain fatty acid transport protein [Saccharicrinis carchari]|uniref:Long-chain fatty acid transport protein n=1 Tax=Saccharicrinis carchari TaxID=1168039 RepID=A0A521B6W5_SACCC|nr:outer membrane protein transport protein [Saccharicrinis carchari]SMO42847.1 long-chain fatty acid transport protein [Saccharicrinis carchari]